MSDMLAEGLAWLTQELKENASQTVTYSRGYDSVDVQATFGKKLLKLGDEFGLRVEWTDLDFCIPAADLFFTPGELIVPERGDLVHVVINDQVETFEVFPFGNEAPWRWADPHQSMVRVHTKHISTEQFYG